MKKLFSFLCILNFFSFFAQAQTGLPDPMSPPRMVNDFAGIFTPAELSDLENIVRNYHDSTTTQIYIVSVNTLDGDSPNSYASRLGEKWEIGQKGKDNGVLILIKPKTGNERGQFYIATGYGVEARITDAMAGRIIDTYAIPYLQENDYYHAVKESVYAIIGQLAGEYAAGDTDKVSLFEKIGDYIACFCILPLFVFLMIFSKNFRRLILFSLLFGRNSGGGRGGRFGGGGGGRFGGGGAGRSW